MAATLLWRQFRLGDGAQTISGFELARHEPS